MISCLVVIGLTSLLFVSRKADKEYSILAKAAALFPTPKFVLLNEDGKVSAKLRVKGNCHIP